MPSKPFLRAPLAALVVAGLGLAAGDALATHSWGGYHWARTANPFTLKVGNNVTGAAWNTALAGAISDWNASNVLNLTGVAGLSNPKNCRATSGRVEVCNSKYGNNGWLGIATISITGGTHITQGTVKLNDTYFNTATYNTSAWRALVTCQEIGHTFGLDHQDENFNNANLGTCMDYTSSPGTNQHPNGHDYDELDIIYAHLDGTTTISQGGASAGFPEIDHDNPGSWGRLMKLSKDGRTAVYELDLGGGRKIVTFVIFALEANGKRPE
jgi:hypothetical protein